MKRSWLILSVVALALWACGESGDSGTTTPEVDSTMDAQADAAATPAHTSTAVCLWEQAGLRTAPGRGDDAKWVTAINFGEVVTLTGEETTVESEDRSYLKMRLSGGVEGWSNAYLFATDADRAVSFGTIDLYKRPELTTFSGGQFEIGEIFAIKRNSEEPGWLEVLGKERKKSGWIQENSRYSLDEVDVSVAILMEQAMSESSPPKQQAALERIISSSTFSESPLIGGVREKLEEIKQRAELPPTQLYITATKLNVRTEPNVESEVKFQATEGQIGDIMERGSQPVEVNGKTDYWYLVDIGGQEGWVFGHFTSKALETD